MAAHARIVSATTGHMQWHGRVLARCFEGTGALGRARVASAPIVLWPRDKALSWRPRRSCCESSHVSALPKLRCGCRWRRGEPCSDPAVGCCRLCSCQSCSLCGVLACARCQKSPELGGKKSEEVDSDSFFNISNKNC